jgi:hypothetical protein
MKAFVIGLIGTALICLAIAAVSQASIQHTSTFTVTEACNAQTGKRDLVWTVTPTNQNLNPKVSVSNRASIAVGSSVPASFPESIDGSSSNVSAAITVKWSDNYTQNLTASTHFEGTCKPPVVNCPEGFVKDESSTDATLVCTKTVTVTINHDVPGPPYAVPGPPVPGPTVYVDVPGPTVYVKKLVKGKTIYVKVKQIVRVCPIKKFVQPPLAG